ncbi:hypothetical protein LPB86_01725 [Pedobacter sp. MC2016-14]|nr:hypothetical protein [Pedobacter sp. MC2016-14]MCD0486928.1 hypothetical protein [Pedobacter sp. MC2016-14]
MNLAPKLPQVENEEKKAWVDPEMKNIEINSGPMGPLSGEDALYSS